DGFGGEARHWLGIDDGFGGGARQWLAIVVWERDLGGFDAAVDGGLDGAAEVEGGAAGVDASQAAVVVPADLDAVIVAVAAVGAAPARSVDLVLWLLGDGYLVGGAVGGVEEVFDVVDARRETLDGRLAAGPGAAAPGAGRFEEPGPAGFGP